MGIPLPSCKVPQPEAKEATEKAKKKKKNELTLSLIELEET